MPKKAKSKKKVVRRKKTKKLSAKKRTARKTKARRPSAKKKRAGKAAPASPTAGLQAIGEITHYFPHVNAGVIKLKQPLSVGEQVYVKGHTTDFKQKIESMQIDHVPVQSAKPGDEIGILVGQRVRGGDTVYRL